MKDTCEFFPEKKVNLGGDSSSSRFQDVMSDVHKKNKKKKNGHKNMRFRKQQVEGSSITNMDSFGFGTSEKITCMGSVVSPKDANKDVYERMQSALLGPQMLKKTCQDLSNEMIKIVDIKRDILAQVVGTSYVDNDKCNPEEKDLEKKAECTMKMFRQFSRLRNQVFTSDGYVKDEWRQASGSLSRYGSGGGSICQDINYCMSEDAEDYIWRWSRSNRKSMAKMKAMKKELPKDVKPRPPAFHDAEKFQAIAKAFEFPHADNPLWSQLKAQPYQNGASSS
tara:strand:- start:628 stop:1467 length:840 start_codon:yes stop_codon:yes gene_type:complete